MPKVRMVVKIDTMEKLGLNITILSRQKIKFYLFQKAKLKIIKLELKKKKYTFIYHVI